MQKTDMQEQSCMYFVDFDIPFDNNGSFIFYIPKRTVLVPMEILYKENINMQNIHSSTNWQESNNQT